MVGDFGGGGMLLAFGVVCGVVEARRSGQGQVVDAAMVDGAAHPHVDDVRAAPARRVGRDDRGRNVLDTGAPFYDTYECADGAFIASGALEPQFYAELLAKTGLDAEDLPAQMDRRGWPRLRERFTELFKTKTRDEWSALLEDSDACFAPVLTLSEAAKHPHVQARDTIVDYDGVLQPAPAPRFSRTPSELRSPPARPGEHTDEALADWGFDATELASLHEAGAIRTATPERAAFRSRLGLGSELDPVAVGVHDVGERDGRLVLAALDQPTAGRLDLADRVVEVGLVD